MHDLRVGLTRGSYVEQDKLRAAILSIEHADQIAAVDPRLMTPTFVSAANGRGTQGDILVRGELVGVDVTNGGPHVDGIYINAGRALAAADSGQPVAILEYHFGDYYHLPPQGQIQLSGGVGAGLCRAGHVARILYDHHRRGRCLGAGQFCGCICVAGDRADSLRSSQYGQRRRDSRCTMGQIRR